jgi:signal transduction protein with GAF and PtsI domain
MPALSAGGPRVLLRRLREIMAEHQSAQARLDKLVSVIAANMVAEVCSIYLQRAGGMLELFATEGLNRSAVHATKMKPGEGLVGLVAESATPVNLSNAHAHPRFSYRPETGEDPYHSFLGVPIVRGERVFGVLVVQNKTTKKTRSSPSPWYWPRWWRRARWSIRPSSTSPSCRRPSPPCSAANAWPRGWPSARSCCTNRA